MDEGTSSATPFVENVQKTQESRIDEKQERFSRRDNCSTNNSLEERLSDLPYPDRTFEIEASSNENALLTYVSSDRLENVGNWVKQTQELFKQGIENDSGKRKRSGYPESSKSSEETDSDDSIDEKWLSVKHRRWSLMPLTLKCEWRGCSHKDTSPDAFVKHVSFHIPDVDLRTNDEGYDVYMCLWRSCGFGSVTDKEIVRHVNFHSYHTKLKTMGRKIMKVLKLPTCIFTHDAKNILPDLPSEFSCAWDGCQRAFNNTQVFLYHVKAHVMRHAPTKKAARRHDIPCRWLGCKRECPDMQGLIDHVKVHTQEKSVGCPNCGSLFANTTKFYDHCKRQINSGEFRCKSCQRYYASERLLRDHMRHHVNRYKCRFCDMTCQTPSAVSLHIRYRHLEFKPFKCEYCRFGAKTQRDLNDHLNTHIEGPVYSCEKCEYTCRTLITLNRHTARAHDKTMLSEYCCHVCSAKGFFNGSALTKHLFNVHNFQWTPGHKRFTYTRSEDGYYRLKPYRLETVEVTQEFLQEEMEPEISPSAGRYNLRRRKSQSQDELAKENECENKMLVISVEQFDASGNVVNKQTLETEEVSIQKLGNAMSYYSNEDID